MKTAEEKAKEYAEEAIESVYSDSESMQDFVQKLKKYAKVDFSAGYKEGQSSPKIKQLEWEHGLYNTLLSKTLIGDYTIAPMKNGYHMYLYSKNQYYWLKDYVNTIEEAKQFAQSDFEARIKEYLE